MVLTAAVGLSACDIKAGEHGGFSLDFAAGKASDTWTRSYKVANGGRVELINVNGRIVAEPASGDTFELVGERTVKASSDEAAKELLAKIEMNEEVGDASVRVEVRSARFGGRMFGFNNAQIKWTVKVPKGVEVFLKTTNGGVELVELANNLHAKTTNGGVVGKRLATSSVEASAVNGGVEIELDQVAAGRRPHRARHGQRRRLPRSAREQPRHDQRPSRERWRQSPRARRRQPGGAEPSAPGCDAQWRRRAR